MRGYVVLSKSAVIKFRICVVIGKQFGMIYMRCDISVLHKENVIRIHDRLKRVCNNKTRSAAHESTN